jgi:hypothetical protein
MGGLGSTGGEGGGAEGRHCLFCFLVHTRSSFIVNILIATAGLTVKNIAPFNPDFKHSFIF